MAAYLFATDALAELIRPDPAPEFATWLGQVPKEDQYISSVTVERLVQAAYGMPDPEQQVETIRERLLGAVTCLPYDEAIAAVAGRLRAELKVRGESTGSRDLIMAATAAYHGLELVTSLPERFEAITGLTLARILRRTTAVPRGRQPTGAPSREPAPGPPPPDQLLLEF